MNNEDELVSMSLNDLFDTIENEDTSIEVSDKLLSEPNKVGKLELLDIGEVLLSTESYEFIERNWYVKFYNKFVSEGTYDIGAANLKLNIYIFDACDEPVQIPEEIDRTDLGGYYIVKQLNGVYDMYFYLDTDRLFYKNLHTDEFIRHQKEIVLCKGWYLVYRDLKIVREEDIDDKI